MENKNRLTAKEAYEIVKNPDLYKHVKPTDHIDLHLNSIKEYAKAGKTDCWIYLSNDQVMTFINLGYKVKLIGTKLYSIDWNEEPSTGSSTFQNYSIIAD